jgi:hypothetical protein
MPSERQADARAAFAQWAELQAGCPRGVESLVEDVERADDHVGLLATEVQGRRVVWKSVPAGKGRVTFPTVALESVDAWSVDAGELRASSDHIAMCDVCSGAGKSTCSACGGIGTATCDACGGQRKMYGYAVNGSRRLLNCQTCRGKGELDCTHCRRGIATCSTCSGGGRVQRWIELEWWRRSLADARPDSIARQLGWPENPTSDAIARDADLVIDVDRPHRLTSTDLTSGALPWLSQLSPPLQPGERIARQHLRIARIPIHTIRYRLGSNTDRVPFTGHRLLAPPANPLSAFTQRASSLRGLRWLLLLVFLVVVLFSLARGMYYWSVPTLLSLAAAAGALAAIYGGVAEWTGARRATHRWLLACVMFVVVAIACAFAARPRVAEAERLIAARQLDDAERELNALRGDASSAWADLRLARMRQTNEVPSARALLEQIPAELPQHAAGSSIISKLLVRDAGALLRERRWREAADAIVAARALGVAEVQLAPLAETIRAAGIDAVESATRQRDASRRLVERIEAEGMLVAWERASGNWGTPPLIALRSLMARDVAALEKARRRAS